MKSLRHCVCGFVCCFALLSMAAFPLAAESLPPFNAPQFHKQALLNGMEFIIVQGSQTRLPFVLMVKNGAAFDPVDKWGVTYLTSRLILEGSERLSGEQVREDLQRLGAELGVRVDWDAVYFYGSTRPETLRETLELLADLVVDPRLDEADFQRLRDDMLAGMEAKRNQREVRTQEIFKAVLFKGNPYEHTVEGTPETIRNIHLVDVKLQYRRLFMPNQAQLALYDPGDREELIQLLSRRWGGWVRERPAPFTFRPAEPVDERRVFLLDEPSDKGLLRWGKLGVERGSRDYYALKVFEQYVILSLPFWASHVSSSQQIQASSSFESRMLPGYFQLSIQAPPDRLLAYLEQFQSALQEMQDGNVDPERLEEARRLAFIDFKQRFEEPLPLLYQILESELYNLGINYIANYALRLERVTPKVLQSVLQSHLSADSFVLVVAGPAAELRAQLEQLGEVQLLN